MSGPEPAGGPVRARDLRLSALVLGLWAVLIGVGLARPVAAPWMWWGAAGTLLVGLAAAVAGPRGARTGALGRRWTIGGLVLVGCGLGLAVGAGFLSRVFPEVLRGPIAAGAAATVEVRITGDARALPGGHGATQWLVAGTARMVQTRGSRLAVRIPIQVIGAEVGGVGYGSVVRVTGRLAAPRRGRGVGFLVRAAGRPVALGPAGPVAAGTTEVRSALRGLTAGMPPDAAALLLGLAVGDESRVPEDLREAMVRSGLAHLTAVSGSNTTMVMGLAIAAAGALGFGWRVRILAAAVVLSAFVALVRPQPSVLRAAGMGAVALLALARGGRRDGGPALAGAAGALLVAMPGLATSIGFALSVCATAGLVVAVGPVTRHLRQHPVASWLPPPLLAATVTTAAATLATLPLCVGLGNGLSLVSIPANLLAAPLVPPVTLLGLGAALLAVPAPGLARVPVLLAQPCAGGIARIARWAAGLPGAVIPLPGGWRGGLAVAAGFLGLWLVLRTVPGRAVARRVLPALALGGWGWWTVMACAPGLLPSRWPPQDWVAASCDVGQGDATVVRVPGPGPPAALLVDAGPDPGALRRCLRRLRLGGLSAVLLTHSHADHIQGLPAVTALWPDRWAATPIYVSDQASPLPGELLGGRPAGVRPLGAGSQLASPGLRIDVLWPARPIAESAENNASLVLLVSTTAPDGTPVRLLLSGDVEGPAQAAIMGRHAVAADVFKVAHHGSPQQDPRFAAWSQARLALISVGQGNDYGHPAASTLEGLSVAHMVIGRTDEQGDLAVVAHGGNLGLVASR